MYSLLYTLVSVVVALSLAQGKQGTAGRRRRRRRLFVPPPGFTAPPTPMQTAAPTPIPIPDNDPNVQCEWWKAGMTWDCECIQRNGGENSNNWENSGIEDKWRQTNWFFTPCAREDTSCDDARRRKKFAVLCGWEAFGANGELGQTRKIDEEPNRNFKDLWDDYGPETMGVAVFSITENGGAGGDNIKATFWDDWLDERTGPLANGKQKCKKAKESSSKQPGTCKCTCVSAANMIGTGPMKALLPYRGPGDTEDYISPGGDAEGEIDVMYATYCVGVCGADCDSAGSQTTGNGTKAGEVKWSEPIPGGQRNAGENTLYAGLVSHDVCQAYIGSKKSYATARGRLNGCGDEAATNGACYAAEYSMNDIGGSCDSDQQWDPVSSEGIGGWCPPFLQGDM